MVAFDQRHRHMLISSEAQVDAMHGGLHPRPKIPIRGEPTTRRLSELDEGEGLPELGKTLEQILDGCEFLLESFRVVQAVDADTEPDLGPQSKRLKNVPLAR